MVMSNAAELVDQMRSAALSSSRTRRWSLGVKAV
jgi:hypothetical protein